MTVETAPVVDAPSVTATDEAPRLPSLSPSRAADFKTCPLLFRFRTIDRLPEQPSPDQARGTLVHAVLERLFDLPAEERTPPRAAELVAPQWRQLVEAQPELAELFPADAPVDDFLASARTLLGGYFTMEDPRRLEPAERETLIESTIDERLVIRGYVDRLDVSPAGDLRVVDYKTGGAPREAFEARALFQLKFYALVLWRVRGVVPRVLRLLYLRDTEVCDYTPDADELRRFERTLLALWQAIENATEAGDFRPKPSRLCGWCSHQAHCPAFGGTPPPYPGPRDRSARPTNGAAAEDGPAAVNGTAAEDGPATANGPAAANGAPANGPAPTNGAPASGPAAANGPAPIGAAPSGGPPSVGDESVLILKEETPPQP